MGQWSTECPSPAHRGKWVWSKGSTSVGGPQRLHHQIRRLVSGGGYGRLLVPRPSPPSFLPLCHMILHLVPHSFRPPPLCYPSPRLTSNLICLFLFLFLFLFLKTWSNPNFFYGKKWLRLFRLSFYYRLDIYRRYDLGWKYMIKSKLLNNNINK